MKRFIRFLLFLYQKLNVFPSRCRFYPSCSHYADEAINRHGIIYGGFLALKRLIRCNQFFPGGYDPVPVDNYVSSLSAEARMFHVEHPAKADET